MAYSNFTLAQVMHDFGLTAGTAAELFPEVPPAPLSHETAAILRRNVPLALLIGNERARSELIVAPVLADLWERTGRRISLYSGAALDVNPDEGLNGVCDYLIGRPPQLPDISPPFLVVVEAKRDDIPGGYGQCAAAMVAALQVNAREKTGVGTVFGCVTTGSLWRFLRLTGRHLDIDLTEYTLTQADRVLGVLLHMVGHNPTAPAAAA
mgnify:CR=1 FL=1